MEEDKKEKAIKQAQASLNIDNIYLSPEFIKSYRVRKGLPVESGPKLVMRRTTCNGNK